MNLNQCFQLLGEGQLLIESSIERFCHQLYFLPEHLFEKIFFGSVIIM